MIHGLILFCSLSFFPTFEPPEFALQFEGTGPVQVRLEGFRFGYSGERVVETTDRSLLVSSVFDGRGRLVQTNQVLSDWTIQYDDAATGDTRTERYFGGKKLYYLVRVKNIPLKIERLVFDGDGKPHERQITLLDSKGRKVAINIYILQFGDDGRVSETKDFQYAEDGTYQVSTSSYGTFGKNAPRLVETFNGKGLLIRSQEFGGFNNKELTYNYEFDKKGNWIRRTSQQMVERFGDQVQEPVDVVYRMIDYSAKKKGWTVNMTEKSRACMAKSCKSAR